MTDAETIDGQGRELVVHQTALPGLPATDEISRLVRLADACTKSGYFTDVKQTSQAIVKMLAGLELGIGPFASLTGVHIVDGRPEIGANLQAVKLRQAGYDYRIREHTEEQCAIEFFNPRGESLGTSTFTIQDAERAGLVKDRSGWKTYPRNMLFARAITNGVAFYAPDAMSGIRAYHEGEIDQDRNVIPAAGNGGLPDPTVERTGESDIPSVYPDEPIGVSRAEAIELMLSSRLGTLELVKQALVEVGAPAGPLENAKTPGVQRVIRELTNQQADELEAQVAGD